MAERVAVLAAAASTVGAATVVSAAVVGFMQLLQLQLQQDDDWAIARVRRLRDRRRAVRLQRRRHRVQAYIAPLPYRRFRWELALWADVWVQKRLRFTTAEIRRILPLLHLDEVQWSYRYRPSPEKAFAIFLMRLSWPLRLHDLVEAFGCSQTQISQIFNDVAIFLTQRFQDRLFFNRRRLTQARMEEFSIAIDRLGGGDRVWGWIDGTIQRVCRPTDDQRPLYTGYKKWHGYKTQGIMTPDGLFSHLSKPVVGSRGDWGLFVESGFEAEVIRVWREEHVERDRRLFVFGDPAYGGSRVVMGAYRRLPGVNLTPQQHLFNTEMSSCRVSVEHGFAHVQNRWMKNAFHHSLRLGSSPVACYYTSSVLLANIYTCLRGNQISMRFGIGPPLLEEYMQE